MIFCSVVMPSSSCVSYADTGADEKVTVMLTGDLMCDFKFQDALYNSKTKKFNFNNTFRFVKPLFSKADIVVGNLEGNCASGFPLSRKRHKYRGKPYLNGPYSYLTALKKAGFDGLVMANNHNCDTYKTGIKQTVRAVEKAGFKHTGLYSSSKDKHYFIIKRNGIKVAFLSYAIYFNTLEDSLSKTNQKIMLSAYSKSKAAKEIKKAREAGADYIVGSHAHVLQKAAVINCDGRKVHCVYGMGNFTGKLTNRATRESAILRLTLKKKANGRTVLSYEKIIPCYMVDSSSYGKSVIFAKGTKVKTKKFADKLARHYRNSEKYLKLAS